MPDFENDSLNDAPDVPRTPGRLRLRAGRMCRGLFLFGLLVTGVAWLLPFRTDYDASAYDVFATVAFFARVFLLPVAATWAVLGVAAAVCRRWGVAVASGVLAAAWVAPEVWMAWPRNDAAPGPTFSVASFNLNKDLKDATWAIAVMRQTNADFVIMQEVSPHAGRQIQDAVADLYPHAAVYPDTGYNGMAVFAKTPLRVTHAPDGYERRNLDVVATALGREFTLIDVHFSPPQQIAKRRVNRWQVAELIDQHAADTRPIMLAGYTRRAVVLLLERLQRPRRRGTIFRHSFSERSYDPFKSIPARRPARRINRHSRADDARPSGDVEPGYGKVRVTDPAGEPIAGVAVSLENTMFHSHAQTKTDKDGRYRVELTKGSWHVTARVTKMYHDERYVME